MIDNPANYSLDNQVMKAIHSSAMTIVVARFLFTFLFAYLKFWELTVVAFIGGIIWTCLYLLTKSSYRKLAYYLSLLEFFFFSIFFVLKIGWDSGIYFQLLLLLPLTIINVQLQRKVRILICGITIACLGALYPISHILRQDVSIPAIFNQILFMFNLLLSSAILVVISFSSEAEKALAHLEIYSANQKLMTLANTDPLTNLLNRRIMMTYIEKEKEKVDQGGKSFSLIMMDVDNFKQINDEYGHDAGDFVLLKLGELIRAGVRANDLISRWGGDEFLIMLLETELNNCEIVAEKIRLRVVNSPFIYQDFEIPVTITLGISICDRESGVGNSLRKADLALYKGKQEGKNRSAVI